MAHSWVQMFPNEYEAFKKYAEIYPDNCVLLVDTYNVLKSGIPAAIRVFKEMKPKKMGIRIDSGDIAYLTKKARVMNKVHIARNEPCIKFGCGVARLQ